MNQKTPTILNIIYGNISEANRCPYSFAFSSDINDWINSSQKKYNKKAYNAKVEKKE